MGGIYKSLYIFGELCVDVREIEIIVFRFDFGSVFIKF